MIASPVSWGVLVHFLVTSHSSAKIFSAFWIFMLPVIFVVSVAIPNNFLFSVMARLNDEFVGVSRRSLLRLVALHVLL